MVLDETMNEQAAMLPQLALMPLWNDYSPNVRFEGFSRQDEDLSSAVLPFLFFDDEDGDDEDDLDEEDNFDDMEDDFDDDFDDEDEDDFEDEDYDDEEEDYDYEEDVDYDDFEE